MSTLTGLDSPPIDISWIDAEIAALEAAIGLPAYGAEPGVLSTPIADTPATVGADPYAGLAYDPPAQTWVPVHDPPVPYTGTGVQPTWADVHNYAAGQVAAKTPDLQTTQYVTGTQVANAVTVGVGETIKAMSGFVDQTVALINIYVRQLQANIDTLGINTLTALVELTLAVQKNTDMTAAILAYAIPSLQAQILQLRVDAQRYAQYAALSERAWAIDNIFKPLEEKIGVVQAQAHAYTDTKVATATQHAEQLVNTETLARVAAVAGVATAVKVATDFIDRCGEPMCQTMGPTTPLGKMFKALNILADAALLAWLLGKTEPQIVQLLTDAISHFVGIIDTFTTDFVQGGKTIGDVLTSAVGNII